MPMGSFLFLAGRLRYVYLMIKKKKWITWGLLSFTIILLVHSLIVVPYWINKRIELGIQDLSSSDQRVQKAAIHELAKYGNSILPKLLNAIEEMPSEKIGLSNFVIKMMGEDGKSITFNHSVLITLLLIEEDLSKDLMTWLTNENLRVRLIATHYLIRNIFQEKEDHFDTNRWSKYYSFGIQGDLRINRYYVINVIISPHESDITCIVDRGGKGGGMRSVRRVEFHTFCRLLLHDFCQNRKIEYYRMDKNPALEKIFNYTKEVQDCACDLLKEGE